MRSGDFTELAGFYKHRPSYSPLLLGALLKYMGCRERQSFEVADVGAGTGKLTKMLLELGLRVHAVEPNAAMRAAGLEYTKGHSVSWVDGKGEDTTFKDGCVDWVVMASSFHWTDPVRSLPEFHRILRPGGFFTAMWNPRDIEKSALQKWIEGMIYEIVPELERISSGSRQNTRSWDEVLVSTGHFADVIFMETDHVERMSRERYMGVWKSVNDIRVQAGEARWERILQAIGERIQGLDEIEVPYKIRAWTVRRVERV